MGLRRNHGTHCGQVGFGGGAPASNHGRVSLTVPGRRVEYEQRGRYTLA